MFSINFNQFHFFEGNGKLEILNFEIQFPEFEIRTLEVFPESEILSGLALGRALKSGTATMSIFGSGYALSKYSPKNESDPTAVSNANLSGWS